MKALRKWVENRYSGYDSAGKFWLTVGAVALIVDVAIGFNGGISQATFWHGVGAAMLAVGFAFLPDAAYEEFDAGRYLPALVLTALCVPIGIKAFEQQVTYTAGMRHGEIQHTNIVNARHSGAQQNVEETKTNLKLWQGQLVKLEAEHEAAIAANPWMTTTTASALRDQVKVLDDKIVAEAAGGRGGRAKGCKAECEKLKDERTRILSQIGIAEKLDANTEARTKLVAQIEATKKVLDGARKTADTAEHRDSLNVAVAQTMAQIVNLVRGASPTDAVKADEVSMRMATLGSAGLGSFALLVLAPVGFFLAGRRRKPDHDEPTLHTQAHTPTATSHHTASPAQSAAPAPQSQVIVHHTRELVPDGVLKKWSASNEVRRLLQAA